MKLPLCIGGVKAEPSLLPSVWNGSRHVPKGFELRVPNHIDIDGALAKIGAGERFDAQVAETQQRNLELLKQVEAAEQKK